MRNGGTNKNRTSSDRCLIVPYRTFAISRQTQLFAKAFRVVCLWDSSNLDSCLVYQKGTSPAQGICTCSEFQALLATEASPRSEGRALYCKHLLAVRLLQLQCWDGLRLRHVSSSNLGSWLASLLEAATMVPRHSVSSEYSSHGTSEDF